MSPPIHVLGLGNLGKLLAHSLRRNHPELPITLLFHRPSLIEEWERAGQQIEIVRDGVSEKMSGFGWEDIWKEKSEISNLVVATKTYSTVQAILPLRERLAKNSTLLFLQNGIGTINEVSSQVFTTCSPCPNYLTGIVNHGVYATSQFSSVLAGRANMILGPILSRENSPAISSLESSEAAFPYLAQKIVECPDLKADFVPSHILLSEQLQKLVVNAAINPLTVIFDCRNGELFQSPKICVLIDRLIAEVSVIVSATLNASLKAQSTIDPSFQTNVLSVGPLKERVYKAGEKTAKNISSMRQDALAGRKTEIDYINGWVVNKASEFGVDCRINTRIVELIKEGRRVTERQIDEVFSVSR